MTTKQLPQTELLARKWKTLTAAGDTARAKRVFNKLKRLVTYKYPEKLELILTHWHYRRGSFVKLLARSEANIERSEAVKKLWDARFPTPPPQPLSPAEIRRRKRVQQFADSDPDLFDLVIRAFTKHYYGKKQL